jgi:hypothetical protein
MLAPAITTELLSDELAVISPLPQKNHCVEETVTTCSITTASAVTTA